jgi:hypothetical protein
LPQRDRNPNEATVAAGEFRPIVSPIATVYVTDFFILGRRNYSMALAGRRVNATGLIACTLGGAVGLAMYYTDVSLTGAPAIESFLSAAVLYALAERIRAPTPITRRNRNRRTFQYTFAFTPIIIYPSKKGGRR